MVPADQYAVDRTIKGKLRRRFARLTDRRPATVSLKRAMVSFTFDDAPISALTNGAKTLEKRGLHGTFFVSAGLQGQDSAMGRYAGKDDWDDVVAAGHELACHTYSHIDCGVAGADAIIADLDRNRAAIAEWGFPQTTSFAFPYGDVSPTAKRVTSARFGIARAVHRGVIETGTDLNQAPAIGIQGPAGGIHARRWLEYAVSRRAWIIFFTHDVKEDPSPFGCTPRVFREIVDRACTFDCDIVTVSQGAERVGGAPAKRI